MSLTLSIKLHSSFVLAEYASSIRLFKHLIPSCSRTCSTSTTSWRRQLFTSTSPSFHLTDDQRRCASSYLRGNHVCYSGNRLNITEEVALKQELEAYDEDYDEDNLHMTPNSVTNQDKEQLAELDMLQNDGDLESGIAEFGNAGHHYDDEEAFDSSPDDYVELEEDWEILHTKQTGLNTAIDEVLDNVDDC